MRIDSGSVPHFEEPSTTPEPDLLGDVSFMEQSRAVEKAGPDILRLQGLEVDETVWRLHSCKNGVKVWTYKYKPVKLVRT
jgi:hypothetical protein